jgi:NAD(P)H-hydrate repair Nnr-like enzyme with NAD(P)H-hydrate dehydratase domain
MAERRYSGGACLAGSAAKAIGSGIVTVESPPKELSKNPG